jgi:cardiolipin synthase
MLDNAKHSVRIINPYFVPTHKVRQALKRAIDRGVNVEIMVSAKSDISLTPDAAFYVANNLRKRGAKVYVYNGGFHHTKAMWVDNTFCTIGSANMDSRSLRCDYEVNTVIFNDNTVKELNRMFDEDITDSDILTSEYWKNRSKWKRFLGWFGNILTPVL